MSFYSPVTEETERRGRPQKIFEWKGGGAVKDARTFLEAYNGQKQAEAPEAKLSRKENWNQAHNEVMKTSFLTETLKDENAKDAEITALKARNGELEDTVKLLSKRVEELTQQVARLCELATNKHDDNADTTSEPYKPETPEKIGGKRKAEAPASAQSTPAKEEVKTKAGRKAGKTSKRLPNNANQNYGLRLST